VRDLAVDDTHVYWLAGEREETHVSRRPIAGGDVQLVAKLGAHADAIAVDATSVHTVTMKGLLRVPKGGGAPAVVSPLAKPCVFDNAFAVDSDAVYLADGAGLVRIPKSGGARATLAPIGCPHGLGVDARHVYWADGTKRTIERVAKAGGAAEEIVSGHSYPPRHRILLDETQLYFLDDVAGGLWAAPIKEAGPARKLGVVDSHSWGFALAGGGVLVTQSVKQIGAASTNERTSTLTGRRLPGVARSPGGRDEGHGGLVWIARDGSSTKQLIAEGDDVPAVLGAGKNVYWSETESRTVRVMPMP
jgi:hypothetical protein